MFVIQEPKSVKDEPMDTSAAPAGDKAEENDLEKTEAVPAADDKAKSDDKKTGELRIVHYKLHCLLIFLS